MSRTSREPTTMNRPPIKFPDMQFDTSMREQWAGFKRATMDKPPTPELPLAKPRVDRRVAIEPTGAGIKGFWYLASAYYNHQYHIKAKRVRDAQAASAWCFTQGIWVVSPIAHWGPICRRGGLDDTAASFMKYNDELLTASNGLIVLKRNNWLMSIGVNHEIDLALELKYPILELTVLKHHYTLTQVTGDPRQE